MTIQEALQEHYQAVYDSLRDLGVPSTDAHREAQQDLEAYKTELEQMDEDELASHLSTVFV